MPHPPHSLAPSSSSISLTHLAHSESPEDVLEPPIRSSDSPHLPPITRIPHVPPHTPNTDPTFTLSPNFMRYMFPTVLLFIYLVVTPTVAHTVSRLRSPNGTGTSQDGRAANSGWLWQWAWAADGTVSIVDRNPPISFPARPASFGMELIDPLLGYVIPLSAFTTLCLKTTNSSTSTSGSITIIPPSWRFGRGFEPDPVLGCPELCVKGPNHPDQDEKWIALVQRGGCPFVEKARMAQKLGASAVVVGGDRDNPDALLNMYSERDASDLHIAATYIKYWDYLALSSLINASNTSHNGLRTLSLLITTEYSAWEWYSPIITFIVILLLPTLLTFVTLLIHRVRAARAARRDRAPEEFVHRLEWRIWTGNGWEKHLPEAEPVEADSEAPLRDSGTERDLERGESSQPSARRAVPGAEGVEEEDEPEWVEQQMECAICLEMFAKGDKVRVLPCGHMFHLDEVDEWLINKKKLCPVCKADVTQPHPRHLGHAHHPSPDSNSDPSPRSPSSLHAESSPDEEFEHRRSEESEPSERTPLLHPGSASC